MEEQLALGFEHLTAHGSIVKCHWEEDGSQPRTILPRAGYSTFIVVRATGLTDYSAQGIVNYSVTPITGDIASAQLVFTPQTVPRWTVCLWSGNGTVYNLHHLDHCKSIFGPKPAPAPKTRFDCATYNDRVPYVLWVQSLFWMLIEMHPNETKIYTWLDAEPFQGTYLSDPPPPFQFMRKVSLASISSNRRHFGLLSEFGQKVWLSNLQEKPLFSLLRPPKQTAKITAMQINNQGDGAFLGYDNGHVAILFGKDVLYTVGLHTSQQPITALRSWRPRGDQECVLSVDKTGVVTIWSRIGIRGNFLPLERFEYPALIDVQVDGELIFLAGMFTSTIISLEGNNLATAVLP